jgi:hypothetical protein
LATQVEVVGVAGTGTFTQTGGTNYLIVGLLASEDSEDSGQVDVASSAGSFGTYSLGGTGTILAISELIGNGGIGTFTQTGGINTLTATIYGNSLGGFLGIAANSGATGTYTLSAGTLSTVGETVGISGFGTFVQTGGSNTLAPLPPTLFTGARSELDIASSAGSTGSYTLSGGILTAPRAYVGGSSSAAGGTGLLVVSGAGQLNVTGMLQVFNTGQVQISQTTGSATVGTVASAGILTVTQGSDLTDDGSFTETGGVTQIDGLLTLNNSGQFNLNAGTLKGTGTISGPVFNIGGTVAPGDSPGQLTIAGNYSQSSTGLFDVLLGGYTPGTQFSQLIVEGSANLGGTIEVDLINGFVPSIGDKFTFLIAAGGITGDFTGFASNNPGFTYTVDYGSGNIVEITVASVPEPVSLCVLLLGGVGLIGRRRRRSFTGESV